MSNNNARYDRAREALVSLVEGSAPLNEAQKRAAEEATSLLREAATALNGGRADEAERLVGDAEAKIASATPASSPAPATPPAQPAPAPSSTPTPTTTTPPAPIQPTSTPAPATRGSIIAGGIIAGGIVAGIAGIATIGIAVGGDAIRAAASGGIIAVIAVIAVRAAAQGGAAGITAALASAGLGVGITAGIMKGGNVNIAALTIGSIVGTIIAVATTGSGRKMLEMARFAISNATGSNKSQH